MAAVHRHPVVVQVSAAAPNQEQNIENYFRSRGMDCGVTAVEGGTYAVYFHSQAVFEEVSDYTDLQMKMDNGLKLIIKPWEDSKWSNSTGSLCSSSVMGSPSEKNLALKQLDEKNKHGEKENGKQSEVLTNEIFNFVTANLNIDMFTKPERQHICTVCPNIKIVRQTSENGIERVTGNYKDIENLYKYFGILQQRKQEGREILHSESNDNLGFKKKSEPMNVLSAQYEYFNHVCLQETEKLMQHCHVRIECSDISNGYRSLQILALDKNSCVERAHQHFIHLFQKKTGDLSQEMVNFPDRSQLDEMAQILNEQFRQVLTKKDKTSLILRGPKQEILRAKDFLEQVTIKKSLVVKPAKISIGSQTKKNGIEVYLDQFNLIIAFLSKDIEEIKNKYAVLMQLNKTLDRKVNVIFTSMNANLDLSVHAYENFISAFQKVVTNIKRKVINLKPPYQKGKLPKLIDQLQKEFCNLRFQNAGETLIIIGVQHEMIAAEKQLNLILNKEGLSQARKVPEISYSQVPEIPMEVEAHNRFKVYSFPEKEHLKSEDVAMKEYEDTCPICLEIPKRKVALEKCKHEFCEQCLNTAMSHKPVCPVCNLPYGIVEGDQPDGTMSHSSTPSTLPGYSCGTIVIMYSIPDGIQGAKHPNPGRKFQGTHRKAYLPDNAEGREVLGLLKKAFNQKLIFTVGHSHSTGINDIVTWNDIHHKTSMTGGPQGYGYPDPEYLKRVREELKARGIQ